MSSSQNWSLLQWQENEATQAALWRADSTMTAPRRIVIADDSLSADSAYRLAERLVQAIGQPTEIESHFIQIGASVGIVMASADAADAEELLRKADSAMYLAKASGRGCARIYGM